MSDSGELLWDDLRYFLAAVRAGTLAGAGRASGVRHTTVGRRLGSLERALGGALVHRGPEGLRITALGRELVPVVEEMERCAAQVRLTAESHRVRVRLATPTGFLRLIASGVQRLREEHPELLLEVVSAARMVDLAGGEADLAIRIGPVDDPELVVRKVATTTWALYASPAYLARKGRPTDLDDLSGHELIGYDAALAKVPAAQWIDARSARATVVIRIREMTDLAEAATRGVGLAVVGCSVGDEDPRLIRLSPVLVSRDVFLVSRSDSRRSAEVRAVARLIAASLAEHADLLAGRRPRAE